MGSKDELALLQEQLTGLAKAVESDTDLPANMEDYLVTLNSLKKRIEAANQSPDDLVVGGTMTGRTSSKNPGVQSIPRGGVPRFLGPIGETGMTTSAEPAKAKPPIPNRRAAIEHTRKLNELSDDS